MSWTPQQEEALQVRNKNLLLSAAAGSGKTAVLTERIIRLVKDPENHTDINQLLVLTFTKAAASEMKSRVSAALTRELDAASKAEDKPLMRHLERQITLLSSAQISTLDSFFQSLVRQYFYLLDLDPKTKILADENENHLIEEEVLAEVLEQWYEKGDPDFLETADFFVSRYQDRKLKDTILKLHDFCDSMAFPDVWLENLPKNYQIPADAHLDDLPWSKPVLDKLKALMEKICDLYRQAFAIMDRNPAAQAVYTEKLGNEYAFFSKAAKATSWKDFYNTASFSFGTLKGISKAQAEQFNFASTKDFTDSEDAKTIRKRRDDAKKIYNDKLSPFFAIAEDQWIGETRAMSATASVLARLTLDFSHAYRLRKKQEGYMDFSDAERYALELLIDRNAPDFTPERAAHFPSETARSLQQKYKEVMIDEYQDTNEVQELITALISNGKNRFMVGDIKQSIYRFRQADPTIFLAKYKSFTTDPDAIDYRIDLNKNFRSDAGILSSINYLFRQIMTEKNLELDYGAAEALYPGRHEEPRPQSYVGGKVSLTLLDSADLADAEDASLQDIKNIELEGRYIVMTIQEIMNSQKQVMNKDGSFRPASYGDIAILLRAVTNKAPALLKILEAAGIPAISAAEDDFVRNVEVEILWALLKVLDNPLQDLAMAAVLRSFFVGLAEADMAKLYLAKKDAGLSHLFQILPQAADILPTEEAEKVARFLSHYQVWRNRSIEDGVAPLIQDILEDTGYLTYVSGLPGGSFRKSHVQAFYQLALTRDSSSHNGLYPFLNYLAKISKDDKQFKANRAAVSSDAVRIMTIHKSKGLEFPIVFLPDLAKSFNTQDMNDPVLCHKTLGMGLPYYDKDHQARWPTLYHYAVKYASLQENAAEEARLLYVAMTRARDALYLSAISKKVSTLLSNNALALAGTGSTEPTPLPSHLISNGKSYLDWVLPAMMHHRNLKDLWDSLDRIPSYQDDAPGDHSTFVFAQKLAQLVLTDEERALLTPVKPAENEAAPQEEIPVSEEPPAKETASPLSDFLSSLPAEIPDWLSRQLTWRYDFPGAVDTPAKLTATAAVKLREAAEYAEGEEPPYASVTLAEDMPAPAETAETGETEYAQLLQGTPPDYAALPAFADDDTPKYSGTSFGTLMHKAMELIDFTSLFPSEDSIRQRIQSLSAKKMFTEEETKILLSHRRNRNPVRALLTFAEGPLCEAMKNAKYIWKEMPFSILLPARSFYEHCEDGEKIFLQGVMDCLLETQDGLIIIDYKTDHTMTEEELKHHYKIQLQVYGEAAEKLLQKPVTHLYLWSFTLGKEIEIEKSEEFC